MVTCTYLPGVACTNGNPYGKIYCEAGTAMKAGCKAF